ncbi:MAG: hypothetical protein ABW217_21220 [Polyangiaceae bacterium]
MKIRNDHHVRVLLSSATFWLCACQGELAVVENLDDGSDDLAVDDSAGGDSQADVNREQAQTIYNNPSLISPRSFSNGSLDRDCACASAPAFQALGCQLGEAPVFGNDVVHTTSDGGVVAFTICEDKGSPLCNVVRWTQAGALDVLAAGMATAVSASGDRVLAQGISGARGAALTLIDENGVRTITGLGGFDGEGVLSADGEVVIGNALVDDVVYLARWTADALEPIHEFMYGAQGLVVNSDATAILGFGSIEEDYRGFRWTASDGFSFGLPAVSGGVVWPESQSSDGSVVAGRVRESFLTFRWSEADGYQVLGSNSQRSDVMLSLDGSVLAGSLGGQDDDTSRAFRWTKASGVQQLLPGVATQLVDLSDDGSVAVFITLDGPSVTYLWDEINGTRRLEDVLDARGVDRSGWSLGTPRKLSGDGKVLLGDGTCGSNSALYRIEL